MISTIFGLIIFAPNVLLFDSSNSALANEANERAYSYLYESRMTVEISKRRYFHLKSRFL